MLRTVGALIVVLVAGNLGCEPGGGGGGGGGSGGGGGRDVDMGVRGGEGEGEGEPFPDGSCYVDPPTDVRPYAIDSCTGRDICVDGFCEPAFSRRYQFYLVAVDVPERKQNGDCWDAACGAPDPFTNVYLDDEYLGGTPTDSDTFHARWSTEGSGFLGSGTVINGSVLQIEVYDEDIANHDGIASCNIELDPEQLRGRVILCTNENRSLIITGAIIP